MRRLDLALYVVLDPGLCAPLGLVETARRAVAGGATAIQLRDKAATTASLVETGRALRSALAGTAAALVVNDDAEAARAVGADGLHIGQGDRPPAEARALIGPDMALGFSVETEAAARAVDPALVDHVGAGPVFATPTKPGHAAPIGLAGLARLASLSPVPAVAIGGLGPAHVEAVLAAGAAGLAVVSAVCGQPCPEAAARRLAARIREARR